MYELGLELFAIDEMNYLPNANCMQIKRVQYVAKSQ